MFRLYQLCGVKRPYLEPVSWRREGARVEREGRRGGRDEGEEGGKDSSCSAKRSYSGAVFRQILEVHQRCS